jgi:hypothetical protein
MPTLTSTDSVAMEFGYIGRFVIVQFSYNHCIGLYVYRKNRLTISLTEMSTLILHSNPFNTFLLANRLFLIKSMSNYQHSESLNYILTQDELCIFITIVKVGKKTISKVKIFSFIDILSAWNIPTFFTLIPIRITHTPHSFPCIYISMKKESDRKRKATVDLLTQRIEHSYMAIAISSSPSNDSWVCQSCTFINVLAVFPTCEMCQTDNSKPTLTTAATDWLCPICTLHNHANKTQCDTCESTLIMPSSNKVTSFENSRVTE